MDYFILLDSEPIRYFGIKLYDKDFWELFLRLALNMAVSMTIIKYIYQPTRKDSEYLLTYMIFSPLIFFVCHLFSKVDLSIGFAFGLFAVFSILRYRTTTIPVKEMTYMFVIIAVAVINALATKKVSYIELFFTNAFIIGFIFLLEKQTYGTGIGVENILYEKIENIRPENEYLVFEDLRERLGKEIIKYEIVEADYLKDSVKMRVFYKN